MSGSISFNDEIRGPRPQQRVNGGAPPAPVRDETMAQKNDASSSAGAAEEGSGLVPFLALTGLAVACIALRALIFWPAF